MKRILALVVLLIVGIGSTIFACKVTDPPAGMKLTATGAPNVTEWNQFHDAAGTTFTGADFYALVPNTAGQAQRVSGVSYGDAGVCLFLFDERTDGGAPSSTPINSVGYVAPLGTFSLDLTDPGAGSLSGRFFKNGLQIGASSTCGSYTRASGALLSVDVETN